MMCLLVNWRVHVAFNLSFFIEHERIFKVRGSHVHCGVVVEISRKQCKIESLLLYTVSQKCPTFDLV